MSLKVLSLKSWKLQKTQSFVNFIITLDYKPENIPVRHLLSSKLELRPSKTYKEKLRLDEYKDFYNDISKKNINSARISYYSQHSVKSDTSGRRSSQYLNNSNFKLVGSSKQEIHSHDLSGLINFSHDEQDSYISGLDFRGLPKGKPKTDLILTRFGIFFRDNYFYNDVFKQELQAKYNKFIKEGVDQNKTLNCLNYPVKVKNFYNDSYTRLFIKPYLKLLKDSQFYKITHSYLPQENIQTENNTIIIHNNFITKPSEVLIELPCEYITTQGVIFGKLYITNDYIYFQSRFNNIYNPDITSGQSGTRYFETFDYVFGSLDSDIIYKEKDIKIYIKDVKEVINRRFLYMWQANEIFLKNGKSYYFNLFRVNKNDQFFEIMTELTKQTNAKLIQNCKKYFKKEDYTKVKYLIK
jgi:hypothetical protein